MISWAEPVMGTMVSFAVEPGAVPEADANRAIRAACELLHRTDQIFSLWKPDSPMSRMRRGERVDAPSEIDEVLELCAQARDLSEGWFDPWAMPGGVDPTGLVKGWAADQALGALASAGVEAALVNAGGDVAILPGRRWRVGIRHPWRADALACIVDTDSALATSGCYERGAHLIDPRGGRSLAASATVSGPTLALADALATALAVAGDKGLELVRSLDDYEGSLIRADGTEAATAGFAAMVSAAPSAPQH